MELIAEFETPTDRATMPVNNNTSGAVVVVVRMASGDEVEVTLHPGASFQVRYLSGPAKVSVYRPDGAFLGLLDVDSEEYRQVI